MKIVVLSNPSSGRGRSQRAARQIETALSAEGHTVVSRTALTSELTEAMTDTRLLVVVGGDGTVHHALSAAAAARVPIWHHPLGTENLCAREFGTLRAGPRDLCRAIASWRTRRADLGCINGASFLLMASVGPDANCIHRLAARRNGPISHRSYVRPVVSELVSPSFPRLNISIDGRELIDGGRGLLIIANSRQYALRQDPCCSADMSDGKLDVIYLPCTTGLMALGYVGLCRLRLAERWPGVIRDRGSEIHLTAAGPGSVCQVDGEAVGQPDSQFLELRFTVRTGAAEFLCPLERPWSH